MLLLGPVDPLCLSLRQIIRDTQGCVPSRLRMVHCVLSRCEYEESRGARGEAYDELFVGEPSAIVVDVIPAEQAYREPDLGVGLDGPGQHVDFPKFLDQVVLPFVDVAQPLLSHVLFVIAQALEIDTWPCWLQVLVEVQYVWLHGKCRGLGE